MKSTIHILLLLLLCAGGAYRASAQKLIADKLQIRPYSEPIDSIRQNGRDTVWMKYIVTFVSNDASQIKKIHFYGGSAAHNPDIISESIKVDSMGAKLYTHGVFDIPISKYQIAFAIRIRRKDISRLNYYWIEITDKDNHILAKTERK
jgi:hypothetical protein